MLNAIYGQVPVNYPGILGNSDNEGADAIKQAVSGSLGVPVDYYVLVNLEGFKEIVDAMGGITVNINEPSRSTATPTRASRRPTISTRAPTSTSTGSTRSGSPAAATAPTTTPGWTGSAAPSTRSSTRPTR